MGMIDHDALVVAMTTARAASDPEEEVWSIVLDEMPPCISRVDSKKAFAPKVARWLLRWHALLAACPEPESQELRVGLKWLEQRLTGTGPHSVYGRFSVVKKARQQGPEPGYHNRFPLLFDGDWDALLARLSTCPTEYGRRTLAELVVRYEVVRYVFCYYNGPSKAMPLRLQKQFEEQLERLSDQLSKAGLETVSPSWIDRAGKEKRRLINDGCRVCLNGKRKACPACNGTRRAPCESCDDGYRVASVEEFDWLEPADPNQAALWWQKGSKVVDINTVIRVPKQMPYLRVEGIEPEVRLVESLLPPYTVVDSDGTEYDVPESPELDAFVESLLMQECGDCNGTRWQDDACQECDEHGQVECDNCSHISDDDREIVRQEHLATQQTVAA